MYVGENVSVTTVCEINMPRYCCASLILCKRTCSGSLYASERWDRVLMCGVEARVESNHLRPSWNSHIAMSCFDQSTYPLCARVCGYVDVCVLTACVSVNHFACILHVWVWMRRTMHTVSCGNTWYRDDVHFIVFVPHQRQCVWVYDTCTYSGQCTCM